MNNWSLTPETRENTGSSIKPLMTLLPVFNFLRDHHNYQKRLFFMKKAFFAFKGDPVCFIHVLLNALDLDEDGIAVRIIMEGAATSLIPDLAISSNPMNGLWEKVKSKGLVAGVCKACAMKMKALESATEQGLSVLDDMSGHPSMRSFMKDGYEIITF